MAERKPTQISLRDARKQGLIRYFTGTPCRLGHVCERLTSNRTCIECAKSRCRLYELNNTHKRREYWRRFRIEHPTWARDRTRKWCKQNPEKARAAWRRKYRKQRLMAPEKLRERGRRQYALIPKERMRAAARRKRAQNPDAYRSSVRNRRARKRAASGRHTAQDIKMILAAQGSRCAYCKQKLGRKYHVDHIVPLIKSGSNAPNNLQILCATCNHSKSSRDPIEFARSKGLLL